MKRTGFCFFKPVILLAGYEYFLVLYSANCGKTFQVIARPLASLAPGCYFLRIISGEGIIMKKLIRQ